MIRTSHDFIGSEPQKVNAVPQKAWDGPTIYFLESTSGAIKIGCSTNTYRRLKHLQTSASERLKPLGEIIGGFDLEHAIHAHLKPFRMHGEWFRGCAEVRETITRLLSGERFLEVKRRHSNPEQREAVMTEAEALREIAGDGVRGERIKTVIEQVARKCGLSYWRTFDIWYGKARKIEPEERRLIGEALGYRRREKDRNEMHDMRLALARMEARLASLDEDFYRPTLDAIGSALRSAT